MQTRPLPILSTSLNHPTLSLTSGFQRAIQGNNIRELKAFYKLYTSWKPMWNSVSMTAPTSKPPIRPPWTSSTPTSTLPPHYPTICKHCSVQTFTICKHCSVQTFTTCKHCLIQTFTTCRQCLVQTSTTCRHYLEETFTNCRHCLVETFTTCRHCSVLQSFVFVQET